MWFATWVEAGSMANVLFLVHRMPYPPNKGDKVRSFHQLKHLAARHRVFLGTFIDDPDDAQHLPALRACCADVHAPRLNPLAARMASLTGLAGSQALTLRYYWQASMARWAQDVAARQALDCTLVFSSSMAQYAPPGGGPLLVDLVDVDSAKWTEYAPVHRWPMSWVYRREGRTLLAFEREVAARADHTFLATEKEAALFRGLAPESAARVSELGNGVDADYFQPQAERASPFAAGEIPLVFTGAMDYWPNVDAVCWFASEMLPSLRERHPALRFHIVGRSPVPAVRALACDAVFVSGTVPDVRPYLQHAAVVVAPLRLARGIQNKVLEAMAMSRPVVAAAPCVEAITAQPGQHLLAAADAPAFVSAIEGLLADPSGAAAMGQAGRAQVLAAYGWNARLGVLDHHLEVAIGSRLKAA
jgi:sugar transferase (PEP-CTERM/EpsH1 system associated)